MKTASQLTSTTCEASLKLRHNDSTKIIFHNTDWSFIHSLAKGRYSTQGAKGYDPISLFKAQLLIYLEEVSSHRKLASSLRYNARLCLLYAQVIKRIDTVAIDRLVIPRAAPCMVRGIENLKKNIVTLNRSYELIVLP